MAVQSLSGTTVLITGGNSGIGLETAVALASLGAEVVITARHPDRGTVAETTIRQRTGSNRVAVLPLDLASFRSIRSFADTFLRRYQRLDVLVNNAGLAPDGRRWETAEGFEAAFGVNHLGHALLSQMLLDRLSASAPSRIVVVSSNAYRAAPQGICFDDLQHEREFHSLRVYAESKLANIYFTLVLAQRLAGTGVTVNALNPGYVATALGQTRPEDLVRAVTMPVSSGQVEDLLGPLPEPVSAAEGCRTTVLLAASPEVEGVTGGYFSRGRPVPLTEVGSDKGSAARLWEATEQLIGEHPA